MRKTQAASPHENGAGSRDVDTRGTKLMTMGMHLHTPLDDTRYLIDPALTARSRHFSKSKQTRLSTPGTSK